MDFVILHTQNCEMDGCKITETYLIDLFEVEKKNGFMINFEIVFKEIK